MFGGVLMPSKKTGLYLNSLSDEIVSKVMQKQGYTKVSSAINYIILEYDKLSKKPVEEKQLPAVVEPKRETIDPPKPIFTDWFVAEDRQY